MKLPVYLDNHATTSVDPRVLEAMVPYFVEEFGNAASKSHAFGWVAEAAVLKARKQVAALLGAHEREIVFTSGATESNNLAIKGVLEGSGSNKRHIVTAVTEHKAVLDVCRHLELQREDALNELRCLRLGQLLQKDVNLAQLPTLLKDYPLENDAEFQRWTRFFHAGAKVTYVPVASDGLISLEALESALTSETVLVSVMLANNEIGVLQPVEKVGELCRKHGALFHCDAAQGVGKVPFDVEKAHVDLVSLSGHKLYGPKGVGALYVRRKPRVPLMAQIDGGGHERGMRSGTLNVPGIVGLGEACELAQKEMASESARILALRERLRQGLLRLLPDIVVNGSLEHRLPGNLNVSFPGVASDELLLSLRDLAVSSGSACTSASLEPSYVLAACGVSKSLAKSSLRFGVGRLNTEEEIDFAVKIISDAVLKLRKSQLSFTSFIDPKDAP